MRYLDVNAAARLHPDASCSRLARSDRRRSRERYTELGALTSRRLCSTCGHLATPETEAAQVREAVALARAAVQDLPEVDSWDRAGHLFIETARLRKHLAHLSEPLTGPIELLSVEVLAAADAALAGLRSRMGIHPGLDSKTGPVITLWPAYEPWRADYVASTYEVMVCATALVADPAGHCAAMILPAGGGEEFSFQETYPVEPGDDAGVLATALRFADLDDITASGVRAWRRQCLVEGLELARLVHAPAAG